MKFIPCGGGSGPCLSECFVDDRGQLEFTRKVRGRSLAVHGTATRGRENRTEPICRNGPKGASQQSDLSRFSRCFLCGMREGQSHLLGLGKPPNGQIALCAAKIGTVHCTTNPKDRGLFTHSWSWLRAEARIGWRPCRPVNGYRSEVLPTAQRCAAFVPCVAPRRAYPGRCSPAKPECSAANSSGNSRRTLLRTQWQQGPWSGTRSTSRTRRCLVN